MSHGRCLTVARGHNIRTRRLLRRCISAPRQVAGAPLINSPLVEPEHSALNQTLVLISIPVFPFTSNKWSVEFPELKKKKKVWKQLALWPWREVKPQRPSSGDPEAGGNVTRWDFASEGADRGKQAS